MFNSEDFEIPLEKQLRIQVINKEIDQCNDVKALQENLKQCAESLMKYQHLLSAVLRRQFENDITQFTDTIVEEFKTYTDGLRKSDAE